MSKQEDKKTSGFNFDICKALVLVNLLIFAAMVYSTGSWRACFFPGGDTLLNWGANLGALVVEGQYWRLFSSMFLHAGILHLGLNMYALWTFGPAVSELFGNARFLAVYILSGLAGSLAGIVWDPTLISAGASGALVGLAGAMLAVLVTGYLEHKNTQTHPAIFFAVISASLLYGFFIPGIDNAAHIGGLMGGFFCGMVLQPGVLPEDKLGKFSVLSALSAVLLVVSLSFLAMAKSDQRSASYQETQDALKALSDKRFEDAYKIYDKLLKSDLNSPYFVGRAAALIGMKKFKPALKDCDRALAVNPKDLNAYLARARTYHDLEQPDKALKDLNYALKLAPKHAGAYNSLAWTELSVGKAEQALSDINEALKLDPDRAEFLDTRAVAYYQLGQYLKAESDLKKALALKADEAACHYHIWLVYKKLKKTQEAESARLKAEQLSYKPEPWELNDK